MTRFLLSMFWLSVAGAANAAPVTLTFTGFASAPFVLNSPTVTQQPYTATITYDNAQVVTPVAYYGGTRSTYQFTEITVTMNGSTLTMGGANTFDVFDNVGADPTGLVPPGDTISISRVLSQAVASPAPVGTLYGTSFVNVDFWIYDSTGTALTSTALPQAVNLASFASAEMDLTYNYPNVPGAYITEIVVISTSSASSAINPAITTTSLPNGVFGVPYNATVTATAPNNDPYAITIATNTLQSGLSFNGTTISGTPTTVGTSNVAISVSDFVTGLASTISLPLTINDAAISFKPTLTDAVTASAYSVTLAPATGGTGSFTYTSSGLPAGLTLNGTTISGPAPATIGAYPFTVTATDSAKTPVVANLVLNVIAPTPVACSGSNAVESAFVPRNPGFITINGGLNLLDHLWTTNLTAQNTNFLGGLTNWYSTGLILTYAGVTDPTGCILNSLTVSPAVNISTTSLANATVNTAYSAPISAAWGVTPYKSITVSGQPTGLSFDGINLTGTPAIVGTYTITVTVIDSVGATAVKTLSLVVNDQAISFTPALPVATVGTAYSTSLTATGYGPFKYAASNLPTGLSLSGNIISGIPTTAGTSVVTLTATDAAGAATSALATLVVNPAPVSTSSCTAPKGAQKGLNSKGTITAINGNVVTFVTSKGKSVSVNVPSCAKITWNGGATSFTVGQMFEWNGYSSTATGNVAQQVTIN
jgi:hypothetical protein